MHLLGALLLQEESIVNSVLDRLEVDTILLSDFVLDSIESPETGRTLSPAYQIYISPDMAQILEQSLRVAET